MKNHIPKPVTYNPYKHHYYFIKEQIQLWKKEDETQVRDKLLKLGDNLLDLYFGPLTVNQVCSECMAYLTVNNLPGRNAFLNWIKPHNYKKIKLSDHSEWVVKEGENSERYVHIHPAKNALFTMRVRATTLKTVAVLAAKKSGNDNSLTLNEVNDIRIHFLNLSPVKKLEQGKGILKLWHFFRQNELLQH